MSIIKNEISFTYDENTVTSTCGVEVPTIVPTVEITKTGWYADGVLYYRVDLVIGDGDKFEKVQNFKDILIGAEFIIGTLKLDGELLENQDISYIEVDFEPNSVHYLEYQCQEL